MLITNHKTIVLLWILVASAYILLSKSPTPFDYYTRLSKSMLEGKIYLTENPSWLNELITDPKNPSRFFVAYPPMPAIISIPLIFLNKNISQTTISIIIGSLNTLLAYLVAKKIISDNNSKTPFWIAILFAFGTNHFFLSTVGSAWYFAHIVSVFFLFLAILETLSKKRPLLIGLLLGASYWSRLPTILSLPFFLLMTKSEYISSQKSKIGHWKLAIGNWSLEIGLLFLLKLFLGLLVFLDLNFIYNYLRFGSIFDIGYTLIPNVLNEPWYQYGIFSIKYIPEHLKIIFTALPGISNKFPYINPGFVGLALWFVTPAFLIALLAPIKKLVVISSWLAIFLVSLPSLMHGTVGFSQFGYRFAMDYTPFLIILTTLGIGKNIKWPHKLLIFISVVVNLWGILLSKMNWANF